MASEASRKKAEEIVGPHLIVDDCWYSCAQATDGGEFSCCDDSRRGGPCDCGRDKKVEAIAAALDAARAEGVEAGRQEGAERERWECYRIARAAKPEIVGGDPANLIAARGPMRGPEE